MANKLGLLLGTVLALSLGAAAVEAQAKSKDGGRSHGKTAGQEGQERGQGRSWSAGYRGTGWRQAWTGAGQGRGPGEHPGPAGPARAAGAERVRRLADLFEPRGRELERATEKVEALGDIQDQQTRLERRERNVFLGLADWSKAAPSPDRSRGRSRCWRTSRTSRPGSSSGSGTSSPSWSTCSTARRTNEGVREQVYLFDIFADQSGSRHGS